MQPIRYAQPPWSSLVEALYLWRVVSTYDGAEHGVNQEPEGISGSPGSTLVGEVVDGSENLLQ